VYSLVVISGVTSTCLCFRGFPGEFLSGAAVWYSDLQALHMPVVLAVYCSNGKSEGGVFASPLPPGLHGQLGFTQHFVVVGMPTFRSLEGPDNLTQAA